MSERGSYDLPWMGMDAVDIHGPISKSVAARRCVIWRDEWPPQSEVPHAGEVVWDRRGIAVTVSHGLPFRERDSRPWMIQVQDEHGTVFHPAIETLSRTPPTKRYRVTVQGGRYNFLVRATDEADAIAKAVTVEKVDAD